MSARYIDQQQKCPLKKAPGLHIHGARPKRKPELMQSRSSPRISCTREWEGLFHDSFTAHDASESSRIKNSFILPGLF